MAEKTHCDICDDEIRRTYGVPSGSPRKGRKSLVNKPSFRWRFTRWMLGPLISLSSYEKNGRTRWKNLDMCRSCRQDFIDWVDEQREER